MAERLTEAQEQALRRGSVEMWLGHAEVGVRGNTMAALARRGLAEVRGRGRSRFTYRLTAEGKQAQIERYFDELARDPAYEPLAVLCTHCGASFDDGTDGGTCGVCGGEVIRTEKARAC